ncbi:MAG: PDZ domain-containing protein [Candidatus Eisenbacteria sp.]|nr:PDZ domain-containing protein [Candidatus Eisenbacteria bacterium]
MPRRTRRNKGRIAVKGAVRLRKVAANKITSRRVPGNSQGLLQGYYRFPTICGDQIIFCSDDDLWTVGTEGGVARRLTVSSAAVTRPVLSPDGQWIAFTGFDEGGAEAYVVAANGGEAQRLTYLGSSILTLGWSADAAEVLIASDSGRAFLADHHLYAVALDGRPMRSLNVGPARAITLEPGGAGVAIARNGGDPARWKRYRGGTVGTIWVDLRGDGNFRQILKGLNGNFASPMWIGKRIYFISDHEGIGNLYSCRPRGSDIRRHTDHEEFYARFPSTDGRRIVYHAGADIHLFDAKTNETRPVPIEIRTPRSQRQRKFVSGAHGLEDYDPHPRGHSILATVRGRQAAMGLWEGPVTEFGTPWRGRHRLGRWLADGKRIVALTDEDGEEQIEVFTPDKGAEKIDVGCDLGRILTLVVAPHPSEPSKSEKKRRGAKKRPKSRKLPTPPDRIAITNQRQELFIVDLTRKKAQLIDKSSHDRIAGLSWSPDAHHLAYGFATGRRNIAIRLANADTGRTHQITSGDFMDFEPCFDPDGKYLYFLSLRTYNPVYDLIQFNLAFPRGVQPYLVTLRGDEPSPFLPRPRPLGGKKREKTHGANPWEIEEAADAIAAATPGPKKKEKGQKPTRIDFEGIGDRILAFPVPEGRYDRLHAIPGKVFVRSQPIEGSLGHHWVNADPPAKASIEVYDLSELKPGTFASAISDFRITADGKTLVYRAGHKLRAVLASTEPGKLPSGDETGRRSGWIDLARIRCSVSPADEWRQMVTEAWRLQRDQFWVPDLSKVDWIKIYKRYLPLVDRLSTRGELSDLLWEMQGELGTSHAYEFGGDYRSSPSYPVGKLGADLAYDETERVWRVAHIPQGDSWDSKQASPLAAPGLRIRSDTVIHAVNGREIGPDLSPMECLVHQADQEIWLTISDPQRPIKGARHGKTVRARSRTVTLKTLRSEYALRYRNWVEQNRSWVHDQSGGKVGYVHIPNMGPLGYSEFHRYFLAELDRPGLIIDVRHNGGGHVSQLLLDKLLRKRVGYDVSRYGQPEPYPTEAPYGPMVALTDEWAGSDGDIFSHCWKLYGLGPLIGKRTWGGVIGIYPRHRLVDGTITSQPEFSFWFKDVGWGVENYGTDPDIEVEFRPQDYAAQRDPQLERSLREAMKQIRKFHASMPDLKARPSRALPKLPPRERT